MISTLYEPFRHWSENGSVYILSDTHFDDDDCKIMDPNWIDPNEQVRILNSAIMKNDTITLSYFFNIFSHNRISPLSYIKNI